MASFYAELQVAGAAYPVRSCTYGFTQATGARGRVVAKVRPDLIYVTLDVPRDGLLQDWGGTAYKPLAGCLVFYDAKGGPALETLSWTAGHCVGYQEEFMSGNDQEGAYVCHLTIAAPTLTMQAGGPGSYRVPTPGKHGQPASAAATLLATAKLKAEEAATGLVKKVITPAGELGTEFLGVGLAAIARTASLTLGLLLTPTNSRDDPGYASEWEMYRRNQHLSPANPNVLRLAELEAKHAAGILSADEETELIDLLAKVKGVRLPTVDPGAASPWAEKRRSRIGYKGGRKLTSRELQRFSRTIQADYGVQVEIVKKGSDAEKLMDEAGGQAGFLAKARKIYVRKGATHYELSHERYHAEQWHKLGDEAYNQQNRLQKETYVYQRLMQESNKLTADQIRDATEYINSLRYEYGLPANR